MGAEISTPKQANTPVLETKPSTIFERKTSQLTEVHSKKLWKTRFHASKNTNTLVVIDFTASWCGPCKLMEPTIKDCAAKFTDIEFFKIDVDMLGDVAEEFEVDAMPTIVLMKNGEELDRVVGAKPGELLQKIEKHRV
ncbi:thioredoxin H-type-like [Carica papaya]|uniref:thioredoxin H-type-like n=1 Tax=Carica papaya TaxID=3649 RepID=UPI000B8CB3F4|nr:thioredoxin H-type-like [Carica papaya]